jgi:hypothetical protein
VASSLLSDRKVVYIDEKAEYARIAEEHAQPRGEAPPDHH